MAKEPPKEAWVTYNGLAFASKRRAMERLAETDAIIDGEPLVCRYIRADLAPAKAKPAKKTAKKGRRR